MFIFDSIREHAERDPEALAVLTECRDINFQQLNQLINSMLRYLIQQGVQPGDRIGLCFLNPVLHLLLSLSLLKLGALQLSIQLAGKVEAISKELSDSRIQKLFSDKEMNVEIPCFLLQIQVVEDLLKKADVTPLEGNELTPVDTDASAILVRGSGTTGEAKQIPISNRMFDSLLKRDIAVRQIKPGERHFSLTPFDFYTAKRRSLSTIAAGGCAVLNELNTTVFNELYKNLQFDHLSIAVFHGNQMLSAYSDCDQIRFPYLKSLYVGGSPVSETLRKFLAKKITPNVFVAYGSNEFGEACVAGPGEQLEDVDTLGKPCPGVQLEIVDDNDVLLPVGEIGNIRLKGEGCIDAYENNPEESVKFLRGDWHYPGDIGLISKNGNLIFKGRKDDLIVFDGVNIYPKEIENIIEAVPGITDAAAFSLATGENQIPVLAFSAESQVQIKDIEMLFHNKMGWKAPQAIFQLDELPRNKAGKISKIMLREILLDLINKNKKQ